MRAINVFLLSLLLVSLCSSASAFEGAYLRRDGSELSVRRDGEGYLLEVRRAGRSRVELRGRGVVRGGVLRADLRATNSLGVKSTRRRLQEEFGLSPRVKDSEVLEVIRLSRAELGDLKEKKAELLGDLGLTGVDSKGDLGVKDLVKEPLVRTVVVAPEFEEREGPERLPAPALAFFLLLFGLLSRAGRRVKGRGAELARLSRVILRSPSRGASSLGSLKVLAEDIGKESGAVDGRLELKERKLRAGVVNLIAGEPLTRGDIEELFGERSRLAGHSQVRSLLGRARGLQRRLQRIGSEAEDFRVPAEFEEKLRSIESGFRSFREQGGVIPGDLGRRLRSVLKRVEQVNGRVDRVRALSVEAARAVLDVGRQDEARELKKRAVVLLKELSREDRESLIREIRGFDKGLLEVEQGFGGVGSGFDLFKLFRDGESEAIGSFVESVRRSKQSGLRRRALKVLERASPLRSDRLRGYFRELSRGLREAVRRDKTQLGRNLGVLFRAQALAFANPGKVNVRKVAAYINRELNSEAGQRLLKGVKERAAEEIFGSGDAFEVGERYLRSDLFRLRRELLPVEERRALIGSELTALRQIDPLRSRETEAKLVKGLVLEAATELFRKMQQGVLVRGVKGLEEFRSKLSKSRSFSARVVSFVEDTLRLGGDPKEQIAKAAGRRLRLARGIQDLATREDEQVLAKFFLNLSKSKEIGGFLGVLSLVSSAVQVSQQEGSRLSTDNILKNIQHGATGIRAVSAGVEGYKAYREADKANDFLNVTKNLFKATEFSADSAKALKILSAEGFKEVLGPVADIAGFAIDSRGAYQEFQRGDEVGAKFKVLSAASNLASAGLGLAYITGAATLSTVALPLGVLLVLGIGFSVGDAFLGESDELSGLRFVTLGEDEREINFLND